jgi:hypothetical protein
MDNNFTHILCINVWFEKLALINKTSNIELIIKEKFIKMSFNNDSSIKINWKINSLNEPYNKLNSGDLITSTAYRDEIIYSHTDQILKIIEKELKCENKLHDNNVILFTIVKPIVQKTISPTLFGLCGF